MKTHYDADGDNKGGVNCCHQPKMTDMLTGGKMPEVVDPPSTGPHGSNYVPSKGKKNDHEHSGGYK